MVDSAKHDLQRFGPFSMLLSGSLLLAFELGGYPRWRTVVMFVSMLYFLVVSKYFKRRVTPELLPRLVFTMSLGAQLELGFAAGITGGLLSPLVLILPATLVMPLLYFGRRGIGRRLVCSLGGIALLLAALPRSITGPPLTTEANVVASLITLLWSMFILFLTVDRVARANEASGMTLFQLREERAESATVQLKRMQGVGARVAHELRNPLAAIKGLVQLIARGDRERIDERLAVVQSEIERMDEILREYLTFTRPLEDLRAEPVDVRAIADDVTAVLSGRAAQGGVELHTQGPSTAIEADHRRLKEALINIVGNAIEATPDGGRVVIECAADGGGAKIRVRDTGKGIAPEDLPRVGTTFFTTRPNGTGLGVVLAKSVVSQHGGTLAYDSELGRGTTVTIRLPKRPVQGHGNCSLGR